jgi:NADH-quinone oxidoreductase subunit G
MPTITIDGKSYPFEPGTKLLEFCLDNGIEIPHFCFHPALSEPGNCRQCQVEVGMPVRDRDTGKPALDENGEPVIRFLPKLQTSCTTDMADGMVVRTHRSSEEVLHAQESNLEFLLINHPLDCPICDQAGQCPLQIQAYKYGPEGSRFELEKVHKPKRIELGPRVMLDAERCINCTRCVRFTNEVSKSKQLTIINRGVKNYPMTPPGVVFDDAYSMNTIDICPVGALTSIDARFKARPWETSSTPSISVFSSVGVNVEYRVRDNLITEIKPRYNPAVNGFWMADADRLDYRRFNEDRPDGPLVAGSETDWDTALAHAVELIKSTEPPKVQFLASAHATVEDNYLLMRLAGKLGAPPPVFLSKVESGSGDDWLVSDDRAPNAEGCRLLGLEMIDPPSLTAMLRSREIELLYVMEEDPVACGALAAADLGSARVVLHLHNTTNETLSAAEVALPAAMAVETIGTMVNRDGHAQRLRPAKEIRTINRSLLMEMGRSRLDTHGTPFDRWHSEENRIDCRPSWDLIQEIAGRLGMPLDYRGPSAILDEVAGKVPAFAGLSYKRMALVGVPLQDVEEAV